MLLLIIWLQWKMFTNWFYDFTHEPDSAWLDDWIEELHGYVLADRSRRGEWVT